MSTLFICAGTGIFLALIPLTFRLRTPGRDAMGGLRLTSKAAFQSSTVFQSSATKLPGRDGDRFGVGEGVSSMLIFDSMASGRVVSSFWFAKFSGWKVAFGISDSKKLVFNVTLTAGFSDLGLGVGANGFIVLSQLLGEKAELMLKSA